MIVNLIEEMVFQRSFVPSKISGCFAELPSLLPSQPPVHLRSIFNCIPFLSFLRTSEINSYSVLSWLSPTASAFSAQSGTIHHPSVGIGLLETPALHAKGCAAKCGPPLPELLLVSPSGARSPGPRETEIYTCIMAKTMQKIELRPTV